MPLIHSSSKPAFKKNVKVLMDEVGKSPHVQSRAQALAVAYSEKRRSRAEGGQVFEGPIISNVPGRTDKHPLDVASGAYVIPAEAVSHLGENNTLAGLEKLKSMGPHGLKRLVRSCGGMAKSSGGAATAKNDQSTGHPVPIMAAGGEFVVPPEWVHHIGDGDMKKGHKLLDQWVMSNRRKHINTLKALRPPAKD